MCQEIRGKPLKKAKKKYEHAMRLAESVSKNAKPERSVLPERYNSQEASASASNLNVCDNDVFSAPQQPEAQVIANLEKQIKVLQG